MHTGQPIATTIVIYVIIAALMIWRAMRTRRTSVARLWMGPVIFILLTAISIYDTERQFSTPPGLLAAAIAIGAILGIPLGYFRGLHTEVRRADRPNVMYVRTSVLMMVVWLVVFILRAVIRNMFPQSSGSVPSAIGDGLLAFAVCAIIVSSVMTYLKFTRLEAAPSATTTTLTS